MAPKAARSTSIRRPTQFGGIHKGVEWKYMDRIEQNPRTKQWKARCNMPGCTWQAYVNPVNIREHHGFVSVLRGKNRSLPPRCRHSTAEALLELGDMHKQAEDQARKAITQASMRADLDRQTTVHEYGTASMHVRMHVCMYVCMYACLHACIRACIMHANVHACNHACMHA